MTARKGLGSAFAAAVGEWSDASKRVVRVTAAPEGGWRVLLAEPVPPTSTDVLDVPAMADVLAVPAAPAQGPVDG